MKRHQFSPNRDFAKSIHDVCQGCGLEWRTIYYQIVEEIGTYNVPGAGKDVGAELSFDDCDVRRRKNELKAFW